MDIERKNDIPYLIVLCGIQGAGKTTKAQQLAEEYQAEIVSSDLVRLRIAEDFHIEGNLYSAIRNEAIFKDVYANINRFLKSGKNVIFDATNTTLKARYQIFLNVKTPCVKVCYIMNTPYAVCKERLKDRNIDPQLSVTEEAVERYWKTFEIPFYEEGWDKICLDVIPQEEPSNLYLECLRKGVQGYDQKNPHHRFDLGEHQYRTRMKLAELTKDPILLLAACYHDIGKLFTQTMDDKGICHYYGHANVGAYTLLCTCGIFNPITKEYNIEKTLKWLFYINYHMLYSNNMNKQGKNHHMRYFTKQDLKNLKKFNIADRFAA